MSETLIQPDTLIANRYRVLNKLGEGGMGAVYQVEDRLTGTTVALKRVLIPADRLQFNASVSDQDQSIALATEFRTLANLRHPHVVRVLDYGFDADGMPYFTMEYLPDAQPITIAASDDFLRNQIEYLAQMLRALVYLHRRGIIHRDLKPGNVLVDREKRVKVLDFGLALEAAPDQQADGDPDAFVGTLAYIAPEVIQGAAATVLCDLYAVGVMAYEIFNGQHPFDLSSVTALLIQILNETPASLAIDPQLNRIIEALMDKKPENRPQTAEAVLAQLYSALEEEMPQESSGILESFLQASRFVGRRTELDQLNASLNALLDDARSAFWLLGGESGVGKSRLLEELRVRALVRGVTVVRGQAVESGGLPYQMWRDVIRPLLLPITLSDLEAGILREIVPDIERILGREIAAVSPLNGAANQERLALTMLDVLKRQSGPVVLLLEDLQWMGESVEILKTLMRLNDRLTHPVMVVGTYRTDEAPDLPETLPLMQTLILGRLDHDAILSLSRSILGPAGENTALVDLLEKETEGNVFFIVEVIRALAEAAGRLDQITHSALPQQVVAGGMQAVLERRLSGIPNTLQSLLEIAAVAGRELDANLLKRSANEAQVEALITAGANTAVFDVADGVWRFAHDKLRQTVIGRLSPERRQSVHRTVAEALEAAYPKDDNYAEALATHWDEADEPAKALPYLLVASRRLIDITAEYDRAEAMVRRGLALAADEGGRADLLPGFYELFGSLEKRRGNYTQAHEHYEAALNHADNDSKMRVAALNGLSEVNNRQGKYEDAQRYAIDAQELAKEIGDVGREAQALLSLAWLAAANGDFAKGHSKLQASLTLFEQLVDERNIANTLSDLGVFYAQMGDNDTAMDYFERGLETQKRLGNRVGVALTLINVGMVAALEKRHELAEDRFLQALTINREIGHKRGMALSLTNLGMVANARKQYQQAVEYYSQGLEIHRETGDLPGVVSDLNALADALLAMGRISDARAHLRESLTISRELASTPLLLMTLMVAARLRQKLNDLDGSAALVGFIEAQPSVNVEDRSLYLEPVAKALDDLMDPEAFDHAKQQGKGMSLEDMLLAVSSDIADEKPG